MHYYQFNIADYRKDTAHLTMIEHAIYRHLLDWYYLDEKPIPLETQWVIRRFNIPYEQVETILKEFFDLRSDGWHHDRCDIEINNYQHNAEKNRINGKLGGRPKKTQSVNFDNPTVTQTKPTGNPSESQPVTNNQEPNSSVTSVTGKKQPMTPDEIIFGYGVPVLTSAGTAEKQARSFLGGLRKAHGDAVLIDKLRECIRAKPLQPLEWLAAALPPNGVRGHSKQTQLEARNAAIVADWVPPEMRVEL